MGTGERIGVNYSTKDKVHYNYNNYYNNKVYVIASVGFVNNERLRDLFIIYIKREIPHQ